MKKVDIIMGIYNCEDYLSKSIESILNQSYKNWRLIMCDDKSTDNTLKIAKEYAEKYPEKIILLRNSKNMGLNYTLNKCLKETNAQYIARQDGDDLSRAKRLEKEVRYLNEHPNISFVSTNIELFDQNGKWGTLKYSENPSARDFLVFTPFCHPAVMIRRKEFLDVGGYTEGDKYLRVEDYHLWFKLYSKGFLGHNIQEILYSYRDDRNASNRRTWKNRRNEYYIKKNGFKELNIPWYLRFYKYRPIILGLLPNWLSSALHKKKLGKKND